MMAPTLSAPAGVTLRCGSDGASGDVKVHFIKITAMRAGALSNQEL
jgi:hypothetical protein